MKHKLIAVTLIVLVALSAAVFTAAPAAAACSKMTAGKVVWFSVTEEGELGEAVESYPSGSVVIVPVFDYNCVPKKTTIVTVITRDGEAIGQLKEQVTAGDKKGAYGVPIAYDDETPLEDGEWGVEFYSGKTRLTSGTVVVGGEGGSSGDDQPVSDSVKVQGVITDKKTKKPVAKALVLVLQPGVTVKEFVDGGQKEEDIFTLTRSNSKGQFVLESELEREVEYSIIIVGEGYKAVTGDGFVVTADDPDPLELDIQLTK